MNNSSTFSITVWWGTLILFTAPVICTKPSVMEKWTTVGDKSFMQHTFDNIQYYFPIPCWTSFLGLPSQNTTNRTAWNNRNLLSYSSLKYKVKGLTGLYSLSVPCPSLHFWCYQLSLAFVGLLVHSNLPSSSHGDLCVSSPLLRRMPVIPNQGLPLLQYELNELHLQQSSSQIKSHPKVPRREWTGVGGGNILASSVHVLNKHTAGLPCALLNGLRTQSTCPLPVTITSEPPGLPDKIQYTSGILAYKPLPAESGQTESHCRAAQPLLSEDLFLNLKM